MRDDRPYNPALPLRERQYFHKGNYPLPEHTLWGPGLTRASLHHPATFYLDVLPPTGLNASLTALEFGTDMYITLDGPAHIVGEIRYAGNGRYLATYTVADPGVYELRVEIFRRLPRTAETRYSYFDYWQPVAQSPYTIVVAEAEPSRPASLAARPQVNPQLCTDLGTHPGRYVRCQDTNLPCVRSGWVWLPFHCHYKIFSRSELISNPEPLWIVLAGSSVIRGTFLTGVDYLLGVRGARLTISEVEFCWNWIDFRMGNLRVSFLDFRFPCTPFMEGGRILEYCSPDYAQQIEKTLALLSKDGKGPSFGKPNGPDIFYLETYSSARWLETVALYRSYFGPDWTGRFVFGLQSVDTLIPWVGYAPDMYEKLEETVRNNPQWGVDYANTYLHIKPLIGSMEVELKEYQTQHLHRICDERGMHYCSEATDNNFQMLMNHLFRPGQKGSLTPYTLRDPDTEPFEICTQCPPKLDFSMRSEAEPMCHDRIPDRSETRVAG